MDTLARKICIITGAASGLGKALATVLQQQGCRLVLIDTDTKGLENVRAGLESSNRQIVIYTADVSDETQVAAIAVSIQNNFPQVDMLINNAGISASLPFEDMPVADHRRVFDVNYWGTVYCTKYFLPLLRNSPDSRLVNIISSFALMGFPGKTAYASSKAAIMAFTASLRTELKHTSVKLSVVVPPPLATGIVINGKHISSEKQRAEHRFLQQNGMDLDKAATRIVRSIKAGKYRIVVGHMMFWTDLASRMYPTFINNYIRRKQFPFY